MKPSASKLELLERCPAAGALASVWTESTDDQRAGTARHRFIQRSREIGRDEALAAIPEDAAWREQCEALDLDALPPGDFELAYAYDVATDTARFLGPWLDRAYDVGLTEVSGTTDLVAPPIGDQPRWLVVDFKGEEEVAPAATNIQLGFYALAVARTRGLDEVDVAIVYLGHGGAMRWDRATLGPFELEAVAERVRSILAAVAAARGVVAAGGSPDYATGMHCRRCPAMTLCPAQTAIVRAWSSSIEGASVSQIVETYPRLSDEEAGAAWERIAMLGELLDAARAALRARAEVSGLPLPSGDRLMPVEVPRRAIITEKAEPVLRARFGEQVDKHIERSIRGESIAKLARQIAPGKGQKKAADEIWSALEAAGAVRRSSFVQLRVKKSKAAAEEITEGSEP